jgi:hypothetical protein
LHKNLKCTVGSCFRGFSLTLLFNKKNKTKKNQ